MLIGIDANEANVVTRVGSNQFAFQILNSIYKLDKKNSYLIYLKSKPLKDLPKERSNWQYKVIKPGIFWTQWRLPISLYLDKSQPKVFLTLGHYAPRFSPIPTVISIMDLAFLRYQKSFRKKDLKKLENWTKYSIKKASHILTISNSSKKDIKSFYQVSDKKITVIYPDIIKRPSNLNPKKPAFNFKYLLYLGTLQPRKNLDNLIKAFHSLSATHPKLKLVLAGKKGWLYQSLFNLVDKLNIKDKVIFTGFVESKDISQLIKSATLFILPSFFEGFGIPVLEAMSLGTPVLVSKNSSLPEIVGDHGYYIEPPFSAKEIEKGIITALSDSKNQAQKTIKAKQRSKQFSWDKSATKILEVLNEFN